MLFAVLVTVSCCAAVLSTPEADAKQYSHYGVTPVPPYGPSYAPVYHSTTYSPYNPSYRPHVTPVYGYSTPTYGYHAPSYHAPSYHSPAPGYSPYKYCGYEKAPVCSYNTSKPWCLSDYEYPEYDIKAAIKHHKANFLDLYADVADISTSNSVHRPRNLYEETYLCSSETSYIRPLRAVNVKGKWKIIVNNVKVGYDAFSQTTRLEECLNYGKACPLVPHCYGSKCVQKSEYHRFLVYDPCDKYFPFAIDSFKLPSSCACFLEDFYITH